MKPKEFDDLVRRKFDQNDFEYNPGSWDKLADRLDGTNNNKRRHLIWWLLPLAGIAASIALAMETPVLFRMNIKSNDLAHVSKTSTPAHTATTPANTGKLMAAVPTTDNDVHTTATKNRKPSSKVQNTIAENEEIQSVANISWQNALSTHKQTHRVFDFMADMQKTENKDKKVLEDKKDNTPHTFAASEEQARKTSLILNGGINQSALNTGFVVGGTVRRMLNNRLYIESDLNYESNNYAQSISYSITQSGSAVNVASGTNLARNANAARVSNSGNANKQTGSSSNATPVTTVDENVNYTYNLSYIQVNPGLGYKVLDKLNVGVGPDFQNMLVDNRPSTVPSSTTAERGNIQVDPIFDMGLMSKTEYSVTKNIKAGISYRKGMNNLISNSDRYIERDYLQFQIRWTILNR